MSMDCVRADFIFLLQEIRVREFFREIYKSHVLRRKPRRSMTFSSCGPSPPSHSCAFQLFRHKNLPQPPAWFVTFLEDIPTEGQQSRLPSAFWKQLGNVKHLLQENIFDCGLEFLYLNQGRVYGLRICCKRSEVYAMLQSFEGRLISKVWWYILLQLTVFIWISFCKHPSVQLKSGLERICLG